MKWYNIGAFTFPSSWGAIMIAFLVTGIFLRLYNGRDSSEWFGNSVFWFIITWKLSVILFDFSTFIRQPLSVVYFNGGEKGFWLGIGVMLVYLFFKGERGQLYISWALTMLVYEGAAGFLADSASVWDAVNLLAGLGLFYLMMKKRESASMLLVFAGLQLLINYLQGSVFSTESAAYIVITLGVLVIHSLGREKSE